MNNKIITLIAGSVLGAAVASTGFLVSANANTAQKNNIMANPPQMGQGQMPTQNGGMPNMNNNNNMSDQNFGMMSNMNNNGPQMNNMNGIPGMNGNNNSQMGQGMNIPNMNGNGGPQMDGSSNRTGGRPSIGKSNMGAPKGGMTPPSMVNMNRMPNMNTNVESQMGQNMSIPNVNMNNNNSNYQNNNFGPRFEQGMNNNNQNFGNIPSMNENNNNNINSNYQNNNFGPRFEQGMNNSQNFGPMENIYPYEKQDNSVNTSTATIADTNKQLAQVGKETKDKDKTQDLSQTTKEKQDNKNTEENNTANSVEITKEEITNNTNENIINTEDNQNLENTEDEETEILENITNIENTNNTEESFNI